jgi:endonuclease/exonuclease/phosphatase family metal-dependent hydrolase
MLLATYNLLAQAYVQPDRYRAVAPELLEPGHRRAAVLERVAGLEADLLCLQEVEVGMAQALADHLAPRGYAGHFQRKGQGRPDGCATFWRGAAAREVTALEYDEGLGSAPSGHVALLVELELEGRALCVVNTHLKWDPPARPAATRLGVLQARALGAWLAGRSATVVCGDLNVGPADAVVEALREVGFRDVFAGSEQPHTCCAHGRTSRMDHVLVRGDLHGTPGPAVDLSGLTALPSATEPSDHVPLVARLEWTR